MCFEFSFIAVWWLGCAVKENSLTDTEMFAVYKEGRKMSGKNKQL